MLALKLGTTLKLKTLKKNNHSQNFIMTRILITGIVTLLILGLLLWQNFHGGVPSHHILNRADLPEISNWWGGLVLPILTWVLLRKIEKRISKQDSITQQTKNQNARNTNIFPVSSSLNFILRNFSG